MEREQFRLGDTIREARIKKGYTQEQLSERLDITPGHLKHMDSGKRHPSVPLLFRMMRLLDFSVDGLIFPEREDSRALHLDGLTEEQQEILFRLVDSMRKQ